MTGEQRRKWIFTALALAAGLVLRLWFVAHAGRIDGDTLIYGNIARNWMQHGVYSFTPAPGNPVPTLIRLPGYPLFLIACFRIFGVEHYAAVMYVQCVIDLFTCVLIAALAGRLFGRRASMAALWLSALCPFTATYCAAPLTEVLTLTCIALTFYGLERWRSEGFGFSRWLWLIAAAMAYALLLRPEQGLLAATVIPAMLWMVWRSPAPSSIPSSIPAEFCETNPSGCCRCTLRRASTRALGGAELQDVPRPSTARASVRDGSAGVRSARLSALVPHVGHRLRIHGRGLLELRQCIGRNRGPALPCIRLQRPVRPDRGYPGRLQPQLQRHARFGRPLRGAG